MCYLFVYRGNSSKMMGRTIQGRKKIRRKKNQGKSLSQILALSDQVDDNIMGKEIEGALIEERKNKFLSSKLKKKSISKKESVIFVQ